MRSGAWTSPSPPRRKAPTRRARCCRRSAFRSGKTEETITERDSMAKLALTLRNEKRRKTIEKFKVKRAQFFELLQDPRATDEAKEAARIGLQKLPRDASPVRL